MVLGYTGGWNSLTRCILLALDTVYANFHPLHACYSTLGHDMEDPYALGREIAKTMSSTFGAVLIGTFLGLMHVYPDCPMRKY